jgi:hypothetical protein
MLSAACVSRRCRLRLLATVCWVNSVIKLNKQEHYSVLLQNEKEHVEPCCMVFMQNHAARFYMCKKTRKTGAGQSSIWGRYLASHLRTPYWACAVPSRWKGFLPPFLPVLGGYHKHPGHHLGIPVWSPQGITSLKVIPWLKTGLPVLACVRTRCENWIKKTKNKNWEPSKVQPFTRV